MVRLTHKTSFEIIPTTPFHFDSTFFKPAHFPSQDMKWESGQRRQTMLWRGERLGTIFENVGTSAKPKVKVSIFSKKKLSPEFIDSVKNEVIWRYNLDLDLSGFYQDVGKDSLLRPIIKKFRGLRPMHHGSLYEYLIIAIVLQNATVRRSVYMMQVLFESYGTLLEFAGQKLWCFWKPKTLAKAPEQKLRELKTGYRAKSLIKVSESFASGEIDEMKLRQSSPEEQEKALVSLYGIGPASVGYIMLDVFHRWDFLKHISPWEQKIYSRIFFNRELVPVEKMLKSFKKWGQWKNLAIHYVWENIWWQRRHRHIPWLEKLIRL
jgi:3-methyladenine DNA glycosylase/8-oxoguanine DNA glycosylase